jgi:hypothetical protein
MPTIPRRQARKLMSGAVKHHGACRMVVECLSMLWVGIAALTPPYATTHTHGKKGQNNWPCGEPAFGGSGGKNFDVSSPDNRPNPMRLYAFAKRIAMRSANGPSPRMRVP